jgi:hypothetical protein
VFWRIAIMRLDEPDLAQMGSFAGPRNHTIKGLQRCEPFLFVVGQRRGSAGFQMEDGRVNETIFRVDVSETNRAGSAC